jgi:hypothetical protein
MCSSSSSPHLPLSCSSATTTIRGSIAGMTKRATASRSPHHKLIQNKVISGHCHWLSLWFTESSVQSLQHGSILWSISRAIVIRLVRKRSCNRNGPCVFPQSNPGSFRWYNERVQRLHCCTPKTHRDSPSRL